MLFGLFCLFLGQILSNGILQVALKLALESFPPILVSAIRFIVATAGISVIIFFSKNHTFWSKGSWSLMKRSFFFAGNICLWAIGIQHTTVIMGQVIALCVPIIVTIVSYFILRERLNSYKIVGFIITLVGIGFLIERSVTTSSQNFSLGTPFGNIIILSACISWSLYIVFSKKTSHLHSSIQTTFINFIFTLIGLIFLVPLEAKVHPFDSHGVTSIALIGALILSFGTILQYIVIQYGIKKTSAITTSFFQYLGPFIGALFAIPILHETVSPLLITGGALVLAGVFYATTYPLLKR